MRWIRGLAGWALVPAIPAAGRTLAVIAIAALPEARTLSWLGLGAGVALWAIGSLMLPLPERGYILGHELTHAFWALCMGGRVGRLKVRRSGGSVELSKSNIWIALSPYFFPIYTWFILSAYGVCGLFFDPVPGQPVWMAAVGWTWAFHVTFTIRFLMIHQPDIREHGRLLSYSLITLINVAGLSLWITTIGTPTIQDWGRQTTRDLRWSYGAIVRATPRMLRWIQAPDRHRPAPVVHAPPPRSAHP